MDYDDFGNRMKGYENQYNNIQFDGSCPVIARLDGRGFHRFTAKLQRPFDVGFRARMSETMQNLVEEFNAIVGYTQSDEITLVLYAPGEESQLPFGGKLFKLTSILASACSNYFNRLADGQMAQFDCRVFQVPTESEAINNLLWRQRDCYRNAVLSISQYQYGHKEIQGLKVVDLIAKLKNDGIDIEKKYGEENIFGIHYDQSREIKSIRFIGQNHQELIDNIFVKFHSESDDDV